MFAAAAATRAGGCGGKEAARVVRWLVSALGGRSGAMCFSWVLPPAMSALSERWKRALDIPPRRRIAALATPWLRQ
jgi:hypothetical protein